MTPETKPLLLTSFYGEIPAHIRATFGMDREQGCPYEVVREGEKIPDEWGQALIIHTTNSYNALQTADLLVQLKALNPAGMVFVLPVEVEQRDYHAELRSALADATQAYYSGNLYKP